MVWDFDGHFIFIIRGIKDIDAISEIPISGRTRRIGLSPGITLYKA